MSERMDPDTYTRARSEHVVYFCFVCRACDTPCLSSHSTPSPSDVELRREQSLQLRITPRGIFSLRARRQRSFLWFLAHLSGFEGMGRTSASHINTQSHRISRAICQDLFEEENPRGSLNVQAKASGAVTHTAMHNLQSGLTNMKKNVKTFSQVLYFTISTTHLYPILPRGLKDCLFPPHCTREISRCRHKPTAHGHLLRIWIIDG